MSFVHKITLPDKAIINPASLVGTYRGSSDNVYEVRLPAKKEVLPKTKPEEGQVFFMRCTDCLHAGAYNPITQKHLQFLIDTKCFLKIT